MHPQFLEFLCCPATGEPLVLEASEYGEVGMIRTGVLRTRSGNEYPIVRGIPRFVDAEQYATSFGFEWTRWPKVQFESENVGRPMAGWTTRMWERITNANEDAVRARTVVEFGCGPGRFLDVVRRKGGRAIGIDLSQAVEAARRNFQHDPDVLIVQGDLLQPPFHNDVFDGGYTIGVLHHTPSPIRGLQALVRTVRPGGWVVCCVYPKGSTYDFISTGRFRRMHQRVQGRLGYQPAVIYSHFSAAVLAPCFRLGLKVPGLRKILSYVERHWLVNFHLPDYRWRVLDTFDAITPTIASTHTREEVAGWMARAGCTAVKPTSWCETSACGVKDAAPP